MRKVTVDGGRWTVNGGRLKSGKMARYAGLEPASINFVANKAC